MRKKAEEIYNKITCYANYKSMNGIEKEWFICCIENGLNEALYNHKVKDYNSTEIIGDAHKRFKALKHKQWDWKSFYNGWIEGRFDMLRKKPPATTLLKEIL